MGERVDGSGARRRRAESLRSARVLLELPRSLLPAMAVLTPAALIVAFAAGYWVRGGGTAATPRPPPLAAVADPKEVPRAVPKGIPTSAPLPQAARTSTTGAIALPKLAPPAPRPAPLEVSRAAPSRGFGLQLGAFPTEEEALAFVERHRDGLEKLPLFVVATTIPSRGTWYRVRAGATTKREEAEQLKSGLSGELASLALVVSHR